MADVLYSPEAEEAVLGGLMISPVEFAEVAAIVKPSDFGMPRNAMIFSAMARLAAKGTPIDVLTVGQELEDCGELEAIGGWQICGCMIRDTPSAANVTAYARVVRRFSTRRRMARLGLRLAERANRESDPEKILLELRAALDALGGAAAEEGLTPLSALLAGAVDEIDQRFNGVAPQGMTTGLAALDRLTYGLHDTDLIVIAGRPAMGKSALGLQLAERVAVEHQRPVVFFTAEMPSRQHVERLLAATGRIELGAIRSGKLADADWSHLTEAVGRLSQAPVWFDETPAPRLDDLLDKARRLQRQRRVGLVVVDHAGLVEAGGENRQQSQSLVARSLKALAKELACPVVALVQLNRALEQRADKRPLLGDLRESGEWEQSADLVAMIYRDEVYDPKSVDAGCAELLIRKHRGGEVGMAPLAFLGRYARFENLDGGLPSASAGGASVTPIRRSRVGIDL